MPERPVLYLLPGLLCDEVTWAHQVEGLADLAEVRVPSFYGFDSLAAMAASVLAGAPDRFAVAGHSMGARVALELIRTAPERVERLALLDTGTHPVREGEPEKRQELVDLAFREGMAALAARWLPPMVHPDAPRRDKALLETLTAMVCRATPEIFTGQVRALLGRPDADPLLPSIKCPTLVGVGRQDAWSPVSQHEPIAAAIPGATLVIFEDSGHMAPMEAPQAVTGALRTWLRAGLAAAA
jgi:pimeloyl-ACP methyl ester carboxylesterase